jgi:translation initiation factor IF-2
MSDTKSGDDKTLSVNTKKTLTLKRPGMEQGTVRQNFSHGRTKSVVVETKKRKFSMPGDKPEPAPLACSSVFTPKPRRVVSARRAEEDRAPLREVATIPKTGDHASCRNSPTAWPSAPSTSSRRLAVVMKRSSGRARCATRSTT